VVDVKNLSVWKEAVLIYFKILSQKLRKLRKNPWQGSRKPGLDSD
jgi:hypothetical protein